MNIGNNDGNSAIGFDKIVQNKTDDDNSTIASDVLSKISAPPALAMMSAGTYLLGKNLENSDMTATSKKALLNTAVASSTTYVLKHLFGRERPDEESTGDDFRGPSSQDKFHSFPSGHATAITAVAAALPKRSDAYVLAGLAAITAVAVVGASRIDRDRHNVTDILAGCCVALASSALVSVLTKPNDND